MMSVYFLPRSFISSFNKQCGVRLIFSRSFITCSRVCNDNSDNNATVRVRFAPSPTGFLHLGGLRTALYNFLFAKSHGGTFILRIEDTDQSRVVPGSQENLEKMLNWMGLVPDEGPSTGGNFGPYVQSQRTALYQEKAMELLEKGTAYRCFCTEARLNLLRKEAARNHETPRYDNKCRHLTKREIDEHLANKKPFVIRFKMQDEPITFHDAIYGLVTLNISEREGDPIILKSDGYPTYHLACIVDDHLMKITHVLRGVEWQVSTPKHIMLYNAFDWKPPTFAHLPLLLNKDGTKLSKRQGDIQVSHYRDQGYFSIALLNFMCGAGGGFGKQEQLEILSLKELISKFSLDKVNTNSCCVELSKLETYNRLALSHLLENGEITSQLLADLKESVQHAYANELNARNSKLEDRVHLERILKWSTTRIFKLSDLTTPEMKFLWIAPDADTIATKVGDLIDNDRLILQDLIHQLEAFPNGSFNKAELAPWLKKICNDKQIKFSTFMHTLRIALTGLKQGPSVGEILEIIGKEESLRRLQAIVEKQRSYGVSSI